MLLEIPHFLKAKLQNIRGVRGHFGLFWLVWMYLRGMAPWSRLRPIRRSGGEADVGVLRQRAGHAYLGAALAEDGQLSPAVHSTAGQRRVPLLLQVHSKVPVHRPAAPFPLDLWLHLSIEETVEDSNHKALEGSKSQLKDQSLPFADIFRWEGEHGVVNTKQRDEQEGGARQTQCDGG